MKYLWMIKVLLWQHCSSNVDKKVPTIGFLSHMDTAPDYSGNNVNPQIIRDYDGKDIKLNDDTIFVHKRFS